jgi:hypothetical protein
MQFTFILFLAILALVALAAYGDTALEQSGGVAPGAVVSAAGNLLYCQTNPSRCN